jgi:hypothetical protein
LLRARADLASIKREGRRLRSLVSEGDAMKHAGIALKGFTLDKNGDLVRSTKHPSVSKKIAMRKGKRTTIKRGKRLLP